MWFWKRRRRKPEVRWTQDLRFLCEQDGPVERDLKAALAEELAAVCRPFYPPPGN